jgi:uncharacterized phage protein gp47/JayE
VRALGQGRVYNLDKGELIRLEKAYSKLRIFNNYSISNGMDTETSSALKERILNKVESNLKNSNSISLIMNQLRGYGKYSVVNNYDGPGSVLICLQPSSGLFYPDSALRDIESKILPFFPATSRLIVKNFDPVVFNIKTKIVCQANAVPIQVASTVKEAITNYFNSLTGGDQVDLTDVRDFLIRGVPGLKAVSRIKNHLEQVDYTILEGTSSVVKNAKPGEVIFVEDHQVATIGTLIINVEV